VTPSAIAKSDFRGKPDAAAAGNGVVKPPTAAPAATVPILVNSSRRFNAIGRPPAYCVSFL
jgi:hypothetical protein